MKRFLVSVLLVLGSAGVMKAQESATKPLIDTDSAAPDFSATSAAKATFPDLLAAADSFAQPGTTPAHIIPTPPLNTALLAEPAPADPATPSPNPRFVYGGRNDYRWQLSLGFAWFRFRSSVFDANNFGVKSTVTYFLNEWLGVEGSVTAGFGPSIGQNNPARILVYGGGPKIAWRQKRWEPWVHGIFGGAHEQPQTAAGSRNSYSIMVGGGGDYRWNPRLSFRAEADYVRTGFFSQSQNNLQIAGGIVFHF